MLEKYAMYAHFFKIFFVSSKLLDLLWDLLICCSKETNTLKDSKVNKKY